MGIYNIKWIVCFGKIGDTFVIHTSVDQTSSTHSPVIFEVRYLHQTTDWSLPIKSGSGR